MRNFLIIFVLMLSGAVVGADQKPLVINPTTGKTEQLQSGNNLTTPTGSLVKVLDTTPTSGYNTGALVVSGAVGAAGSIWTQFNVLAAKGVFGEIAPSTTFGHQITLDYNVTSPNVQSIQSVNQGVGFERLAINPSGGVVNVGTFNNTGDTLQVNGSIFASGNASIDGGQVSFPNNAGGTYVGRSVATNTPGTSTYNTLGGFEAGKILGGSNTGYNNAFWGFQIGSSATTAYANSAIGMQPLYSLTTGVYNFAGGIHALYTLTTGGDNNSIGAGSLQNGNPSSCAAIGVYAGRDCNGIGSVFIGNRAGMTETTGGKLYIANNETTTLIYGDFATGAVTLQGSCSAASYTFGGFSILPGPSVSAVGVRSGNTNIGLINYQDVNGTSLGSPGFVGANTYQIYNDTGSTSGLDLNVSTSVLTLPLVGGGLRIKEGTNARMGVATLVAGTVTVNTTAVTATSRIFLTAQNLGTVTIPSNYGVSARSAGTSFTILASAPTDTSTIAWEIIEPAP